MLGSSRSRIHSSLGRKQKPQIRTSHIVLGILAVVLVAAMVIFGSSLHWIMKNSNGKMGERDGSTSSSISIPIEQQQKTSKHNLRNKGGISPHSSGAAAAAAAADAIRQVKEEFYKRYGGKDIAEQYFEKTITSFGSIKATAERILRAAARQQPFVMGFAGYSITVGRGNFFNQSFPFVMERVLQKPMKAVGVPSFFVRNSAIGG